MATAATPDEKAEWQARAVTASLLVPTFGDASLHCAIAVQALDRLP
jgi:hypothetical protein